MDSFAIKLKKIFENNSNSEIAAKQSAYMKNRFEFLGIQTPQRKLLQKSLVDGLSITSEEELMAVVRELWNETYREFHYCACDLAEKYLIIATDQSFLFFEQLIRSHSWWDTVDRIAPNLIGKMLFKYPKLIISVNNWIKDPNMWIRRSALIFQLRYKKKTDEPLLFSLCSQTMHESDFFIKKAIGWALREYSKTSPVAVKQFIDKNQSFLSRLSIREGLKIIAKG